MNISAVILTYNEKIHIERCILSIYDIVDEILVVDSYSTDDTVEILSKYSKVRVVRNKWPGKYAEQFNFGLGQISNKGNWVLRIDADEYLTNELQEEIKNNAISWQNQYTAISFSRRHFFFNRWIKYGTYPTKLVRLFKLEYGVCEEKNMDEHILISHGKIHHTKNDFVDHNLNDFTWWIQKHIGYAKRELADYIFHDFNKKHSVGIQASNKRNYKNKYYNSPIFLRSIIYFIIRYFFRLGFLHGKAGFIWYMFQCLFYRLLVDVLIFELKILSATRNCTLIEAFEMKYGKS